MGLARFSRPALAAAVATGCVLGSLVLVNGASATPVEGTPLTFGGNGFGQLGDGSNGANTRATPLAVPGLTDVIDIAGGREHIVALSSDGSVWTWGSDQYGQQANGVGRLDESLPHLVPDLSDVVDVDDGHYHSLALKSDGTVWGWGFGSLTQLGNDSTQAQLNTPVQFGTFDDITHIYGGRDMTYVLRADGSLWCSGGNENGECANPSYVTKTGIPIEVQGIDGVVDMAAGRNHAVALRSDGTVWTWGLNESGQLGDGLGGVMGDKRAEPQQVAGLSGIVDVGAGADHSIAVTSDGEVYTWGENGEGQLGLGDTVNRLVPTLVPGISDAAISEAGRETSLIITDTGGLITFGKNDMKQSANDSGDARVLSPYLVPDVSGVIAAAGGRDYSVVLQGSTIDPGGPVFTDGFDNGLVGWTGGLAFIQDNAQAPLSGALPSLRAVLNNSRLSAWHALPNALSDSCTSIDIRLTSRATPFGVLRLRTANGTGLATVLVVGHRKLRVRDELSGQVFDTSQVLPARQWHELTLCSSHPISGTDQLALSYDGAVVGSWAGAATGDVGQIQIGSTRKATATFNLDNVEVVEP